MKIKKETVAIAAGILISLFVLGMATYGANQLVNSFFDKNVISPKGVIHTFQLQKPRLWVDKTTYQKELEVEQIYDNAVDDAVEVIRGKLSPTPTPKPRSLKIGEVLAMDKVVECKDVVGCIREVGESMNVSNQDIMTMIRIAKAESGYNPTIGNKKSSARGVFQILLGTWEFYNCDGSRLNYHDNINCAYKLYQARGFKDWDASKSKWLN